MSLYSKAFIVYANNFQFRAEQIIEVQLVQSRMIVFCRTGSGLISVNGESFEFHSGDFLFIPWLHHIKYIPSKTNPYCLGCIHFIPHTTEIPLAFDVDNNIDGKTTNALFPLRNDIPLSGLEKIFKGNLNFIKEVEFLFDYIIYNFHKPYFEDSFSNHLCQLLIREMLEIVKITPTFPKKQSHTLNKMTTFITNNSKQNISIKDLAKTGNCSQSTVSRLFQQHFKKSPMNYIQSQRIENAGKLLTDTALRVGEIAEEVGIEDPYYFSKLFKKFKKCTPGEFRKRNLLFPE